MLAGITALVVGVAAVLGAIGAILKTWVENRPDRPAPPAPISTGMTVDVVDPAMYASLADRLGLEMEQHARCDALIIRSGIPPLHD